MSQADPARCGMARRPGRVVSGVVEFEPAPRFAVAGAASVPHRQAASAGVAPAVRSSSLWPFPRLPNQRARQDPIAVIGLGRARLPGALSRLPEHWDNLIQGKKQHRLEAPEARWDWELFWDEDKSVPDKIAAKIGGFLQGFKFDLRTFRIP